MSPRTMVAAAFEHGRSTAMSGDSAEIEAVPGQVTTESDPANCPAEQQNGVTPPTVRSTKHRAESTKAELVLKKLRLARGVTVSHVKELTGWQPHSVRGFLSAVVRKKLGLNLVSEVGKDGQRRYRILGSEA